MINFFDNDLADEFEEGEERFIVVNGEKQYQRDFESIKANLDNLK